MCSFHSEATQSDPVTRVVPLLHLLQNCSIFTEEALYLIKRLPSTCINVQWGDSFDALIAVCQIHSSARTSQRYQRKMLQDLTPLPEKRVRHCCLCKCYCVFSTWPGRIYQRWCWDTPLGTRRTRGPPNESNTPHCWDTSQSAVVAVQPGAICCDSLRPLGAQRHVAFLLYCPCSFVLFKLLSRPLSFYLSRHSGNMSKHT